MELNSRLTPDGRVAILELTGRFDAFVAEAVSNWFFDVIGSGSSQLVANLAKVTFIDSTGLAVLVDGLKRCRQQNGNLHLCNLGQTVRVIFELTRLDAAFEIFSEEQEAVAAYG